MKTPELYADSRWDGNGRRGNTSNKTNPKITKHKTVNLIFKHKFYKQNQQNHRITFSCHLMSSAFCLFTLPPPIRTNVLNYSVKNSDGQCNYSFVSAPYAGITNMWCTLMWMCNERKYWCAKNCKTVLEQSFMLNKMNSIGLDFEVQACKTFTCTKLHNGKQQI